tara:strand:+ start:1766 stop:1999 length:234 start_codon:yes stop_codon:yes gene_type:complete
MSCIYFNIKELKYLRDMLFLDELDKDILFSIYKKAQAKIDNIEQKEVLNELSELETEAEKLNVKIVRLKKCIKKENK